MAGNRAKIRKGFGSWKAAYRSFPIALRVSIFVLGMAKSDAYPTERGQTAAQFQL